MKRQAADFPAKRPYYPPKLTVYGDLTELTMTKMTKTGQFDNVKKTRRT